jgi:hypothetical protein
MGPMGPLGPPWGPHGAPGAPMGPLGPLGPTPDPDSDPWWTGALVSCVFFRDRDPGRENVSRSLKYGVSRPRDPREQKRLEKLIPKVSRNAKNGGVRGPNKFFPSKKVNVCPPTPGGLRH